MRVLDITFATPEENLACDEALLADAETGSGPEVLRFWEPEDYFVVLGYSNRARAETDFERCGRDRVPVLRRPSGGGAVLQGAGCLNYSLVLRIPSSGPFTSLMQTTRLILERHCGALKALAGGAVAMRGTSDLALGDRKFSGNAQRRGKNALLFHGTFLCGFEIPRMENYLRRPSREPGYRAGRAHRDFVTNLALSPARVKQALRSAWDAREDGTAVPREKIRDLVRSRYSLPAWNLKF